MKSSSGSHPYPPLSSSPLRQVEFTFMSDRPLMIMDVPHFLTSQRCQTRSALFAYANEPIEMFSAADTVGVARSSAGTFWFPVCGCTALWCGPRGPGAHACGWGYEPPVLFLTLFPFSPSRHPFVSPTISPSVCPSSSFCHALMIPVLRRRDFMRWKNLLPNLTMFSYVSLG